MGVNGIGTLPVDEEDDKGLRVYGGAICEELSILEAATDS